jgi:DHA1 family bicyclomycin/chloramphenicol resistance-like MFS transporter
MTALEASQQPADAPSAADERTSAPSAAGEQTTTSAPSASASSSPGSSPSPSPPASAPKSRISFAEFVGIIALMMGMTAYSVDNLLPAFDSLRASFALADPNAPQLLVYGYMMAFALAQVVYGPVSDMVGRRPVLIGGMVIYMAGCLLAILAPSFTVLMVSRVIQGIGSAAARVLAVAIVRDRFEGREMARVMSLAMMVFLIVPIFAPALGSALLMFGPWQWIFVSMLAVGLTLSLWFGRRMPETLHPEFRFPFSAKKIASAVTLTATRREALGYATGVGLMMGCVLGYVGSAQQILETTVYGLGPSFSLYFALVAATMAVGSLLNSRVVRRFGMRRLSHGAIIGFTAIAGVLVAVALAYGGRPPLALFIGLVAAAMFLFALTVPNFNTMAMEPLGAVAGTAAAFIGAYTTLLGALCGLAVGQSFDGTVTPLAAGYFILSALCLLVLLWTERGRLFVARH